MSERETFATRIGVLASMIGLAVGLGNVWRFPYIVGVYGGAAFILVYVLIATFVAVPALMAEWTIGRHTRRGALGAYERAGAPGGRVLGWLLCGVVTAALAYYSNVIGWVVYYAVAQLLEPLGRAPDASAILPPPTGYSRRALGLQMGLTVTVLGAQALIVLKGVRAGIERVSTIVMPLLALMLLVVIVRSLTLPGAGEGVAWLLSFDASALTPTVGVVALGHVVFSVGLGGTLMVAYGSYLDEQTDLRVEAAWTVAGDTVAGLLAGLAIFPAVFALGLEPASGPGLLFETLPEVFSRVPGGWIFGFLFFAGLASAALLSGVAAYEVLVAGLTDTLGWPRRRAVWMVYGGTLALALPPMLNLAIFVPWDLTFGSGGQTFGMLIAVLTFGWAMSRATVLEEIAGPRPSALDRALVAWVRWVVPAAILAVAAWWLLSDVLKVLVAP